MSPDAPGPSAAVLVIVGTGLIGGSFALAARSAGLAGHIVGVDPDGGRAAEARRLGLVDAVADGVPADADLVVLAGPAGSIAGWVCRLADHPGLVIDVASVKGAVLDAVRAARGSVPGRFVPCHPISGGEQSGPAVANGALFRDRLVVVTPDSATEPQAIDGAVAWWRALGARVERMDPTEHDRVYAVTSHLPHLAAFAYLQQIRPEHLPHAGGGFRDFTRIGASDPGMWSSIFDLNRAAVLEALGELREGLDAFEAAIEARDLATLEALIEAARRHRQGFRDD